MKKLSDYVDCNPTVKLKKGSHYTLVDINSIEIGRKYSGDKGTVEYTGQGGSKFSDGDTIMARITPCLENGKLAQYRGCIDAIGSTELFVFRAKKGISSADFVYYFMKQAHVRNYAANSMTGASGRQRADIGFIKKLKCNFPQIAKQERIASILSAYDNLIENNNKRIKILEQMAENLYKEWFICFRFPGYESSSFVASSIGRIPEGFSVLKMQDVIDYHIGGGWGSDVRDKNFECEAFVIRGTDFPYVKEGILSTCPRRYHKINNYRTRKLEEGDIILEVSGGTAEQPVGRALLVTKDTLRRFGRKLICASFCKLVRLKRNIISPYYFIYWMNFLYSTRIIEKFQLQSTGIINFKFEYFFKKGDILLPPVDLMHIFVGKINTIKAQIDKLAEVNENLTKQRDMLLPRLMSGKLEV